MKKKGRLEKEKCILGRGMWGKNRRTTSRHSEKALCRRGGEVQWKVTREKGA